ncbi:MAG: enoyl-CoA hydratase/isomerase family protein [Proteobacteria bacterium]|nr:enoyl-CoA hydratase/isomerase family protein [Pseudomonadota bacterium]
MRDYQTLDLVRDGATDWLTFNRPERLNAFNPLMVDELLDYFEDTKSAPETRIIVIRGAGRAFCAGADVKDFMKTIAKGGEADFQVQRKVSSIIYAMRRCPQPIIALVHGAATGGGFSLALAADIRIAGLSARMNCAFIKIGLTGADMGTSFHLPRLVGTCNAAALMYTGRFIGAVKAERIGLVNDAVEDEDMLEVAQGYIREMLATAPLGLRLTKDALNAAIDAPSLTATLALEDRNQVMTINSPDLAEGLAALREHRPPKWN